MVLLLILLELMLDIGHVLQERVLDVDHFSGVELTDSVLCN